MQELLHLLLVDAMGDDATCIVGNEEYTLGVVHVGSSVAAVVCARGLVLVPVKFREQVA